MPKHVVQAKREDLYWTTALKDYLEKVRVHYKGEELKWLDSIILSCDVFAETIFKGVDRKEVRAILNFANTVRPILYTDKLYTEKTHPEDIIKCDADDIWGMSEFALDYCRTKCQGDFDTCKLREYLRNLQVPPFVDKGPCEYFQREVF